MINKSRLLLFILTCLVLWKLFSFLPSQQDEKSIPLAEEKVSTSKPSIVPLRVDVFYETLCPDSRSFFIRQLLPTYEKSPELLDISLIPYGKASTQQEASGKYLFNCQHGPTECHGNKVHACAVESVAPSDLLLRYTTCMISDNSDPDEAGRKCANSLGIEWEPIKKCTHSEEGDKLLAQHGESTKRLHPKVAFIPTIRVNEELDGQPALLKDLFKELCSRFKETPQACL
ncbi:hypothetical protein B566_EDAN002317 [Ephemera danica]|nr:hypothetical protein B566_EDAN002317 [Ephemera danica]